MYQTQLTTQIAPLRWMGDRVRVLDQRHLPTQERYWDCATVTELAEAIRTLAVRGAPLIGIAAAYGMVLGAQSVAERGALHGVRDLLAATRPTAVNLFWALDRCMARLAHVPDDADLTTVQAALLDEADAIRTEDAAACAAMAAAGAAVVPAGARLLTHCNAGALATGGVGTALGVVRAAHAAGTLAHVWVDETRPLLQGARLTAWELGYDGIPHTILCDNMAASLMAAGQVDLVVVGTDRIARNGDFANKIGTYGVAVLAHAHGIPFYVASPFSTIDFAIADGTQIPIELRRADEVTCCGGATVAPAGSAVWNPAFDVTPGRLVRGFITERGVIAPEELAGYA